jgi:hypothetical protein
MSFKIRVFDAWRRRIEKQLSRDLDTHLVSEGHSSVTDRAIENDFFASFNLSGFKISAIGGRALSKTE